MQIPFYDADDFHSPENKEKMALGEPLTDQDRYPWLVSLGKNIREIWSRKGGAIVACSALKESYREILSTESKESG